MNDRIPQMDIDGRFYLDELGPDDEGRLLEIANTEGYHYAALNGYYVRAADGGFASLPVEGNVKQYLFEEAIKDQQTEPRVSAYFAIRDRETGNRVAGVLEFIHQEPGDFLEKMEGETEAEAADRIRRETGASLDKASTEIAYFTAPEYEGQRLVQKALAVAIPHVTDTLKTEGDFVATVDPGREAAEGVEARKGNDASRNILEQKLGFKEYGSEHPAWHEHPGLSEDQPIYYATERVKFAASRDTIIQNALALRERLGIGGREEQSSAPEELSDGAGVKSFTSRFLKSGPPKRREPGAQDDGPSAGIRM